MATGTESVMFATMQRQPSDLRRVLDQEWGVAGEAAGVIASAKRVILAGMGTSYCAAVAGAWMLRAAGAATMPVHSFDLALYPEMFRMSSEDVVVILSHSGLKKYSHQLFTIAKTAGARVVAVTGTEATIEGADVVLRTAEREKSAAYTSSHICAMAAVAQIATELGGMTGAAATAGFRAELAGIPTEVEQILARAGEMETFSRRSASRQNYAVGGGPNEASALEVVIKVREAAFGRIDGMGLEQYLHGPVAALNAGDGVLLVNCPGPATQRVDAAAKVFATIGADMLVIGEPTPSMGDAQVFPLPAISEWLSPLLSLVPMQLFAYQMATASGVCPDRFRRDTPKYAMAFSEMFSR